MNIKKTILITGGAGFIGRHVTEYFIIKYPHYHCIVLDNLSYSGDLKKLDSICQAPNFTFIKADINHLASITNVFNQYPIQGVIHLAAETHVDNSITQPIPFVKTNVLGTANLLEASKNYLQKYSHKNFRYLQISTDEVFGSIGAPNLFNEKSSYQPSSPYSASKAAADHLVMSYHKTFNFPAIISYCTNNYGPYQHTEKLIPNTIAQALQKRPIPIYGSGQQIRDWIAVEDHVRAIDVIFQQGAIGESYAISAQQEYSNLDVVMKICNYLESQLDYLPQTLSDLITHITDRPGHDFRYALDSKKINNTLQWQPIHAFEKYLYKSIDWYLSHPEWLKK